MGVEQSSNTKTVCWAILVSNEFKLSSDYLVTLRAQNYEKQLIHLYIVNSDNTVETGKLIKDFIEEYGSLYLGVTFLNAAPVTKQFAGSPSGSSSSTFNGATKIRQASVEFAKTGNFDYYFVSDVNNFLTSKVLTELMKLELPIVAPLLSSGSTNLYEDTNFQEKSGPSGQLLHTQRHAAIVSRELSGILQVDQVKGTYLVKNEVLQFIDYGLSDNFDDNHNLTLSLLNKSPLTRQFLEARQFWGALITNESLETSKDLISKLEKDIISFSDSESQKEILIAKNAYYAKIVVSSSRFAERHIRFRYDNLHINFDFVFDHGREIAHTRNSYPSLSEATSILKPGSIDRALTHIRLLEEAIERNETVLILEDDVKLHKDFDRVLEGLVSKRGDFDTLLLGFNWDSMIFVSEHEGSAGIVKQSFNQRGLLESWDDIESTFFVSVTRRLLVGWGLCATLTTPQGAEKVLNHLRNFQPEFFDFDTSPVKFEFKSFDSIMNAVYKDLESFVVTPPIAWVQNDKNTSTIWNS